MEHKILVCYASATGSTGEVAQFIGKRFENEGAMVDVEEVSKINDLQHYSSVVMGSSIRFGRWLPEAIDFLDVFGTTLSDRPTAFFTTCLTMREKTADAYELATTYWSPILSYVPGVEPIGLGLFAGSLGAHLAQHAAYDNLTPYGDYRDWEEIQSWSEEIYPHLLEEGKPKASFPLVLRGTILSYTDMSGHDLSAFDLQNAELVEAQLNRADMSAIDLRKADLSTASFRGAKLIQANLSWAHMPDTNGREANFQKANLMGTNLKNADLQSADFEAATMNGVSLINANLEAANLQRCDLNWADLRQANLEGADLSNADLAWANLCDTDLSRSKLTGARYNSQTKWPEGFVPEAAGCELILNHVG